MSQPFIKISTAHRLHSGLQVTESSRLIEMLPGSGNWTPLTRQQLGHLILQLINIILLIIAVILHFINIIIVDVSLSDVRLLSLAGACMIFNIHLLKM